MLTYTTTMDNPSTYRATVSRPAQDIYNAIKNECYTYVLYDDEGNLKDNRYVYLKNTMYNSEFDSYIIDRPKTAEDIRYFLKARETKLIFSNYSISQLLHKLNTMQNKPELSVIGDGTGTSICGHGYFQARPGFDEAVGLCSLAYHTCSQFENTFYKVNRDNENKGLFTSKILCAKNIAAVKDEMDQWLKKPNLFNYYVSTAVDYQKALINGISEEDMMAVMESRIRTMLVEIINGTGSYNKPDNRILVIPPYGLKQGHSILNMTKIFVKLLQDEGLYKYFSYIIVDSNFNETHCLPSSIRDAYNIVMGS